MYKSKENYLTPFTGQISSYVRAPYPYFPWYAFGVNPNPYFNPYYPSYTFEENPNLYFQSYYNNCGQDFPGACPDGFHATTAGCQPCPPYKSISNERFKIIKHID